MQVAGAGHARRERGHRRRRFWGGAGRDRAMRRRRPTCSCSARPPAAFPRASWTVAEGRAPARDRTWTAPAMSACWATAWPRPFSRSARRWASASRSTASTTPSSACSSPKAARWAATRTISPSCPSPPALNRFGRWNRSLTILVQAREPGELRRHRRAGARHPARDPQSAARAGGRLRDLLQRFADRAVQLASRMAVRIGVIGRQFHRAAGRRHRHHEHHAGLGDRADARDRHPPRHRRQEAQHHDPVHHGSGRALRGGRRRSAWCWASLGGNATAFFLKLPPVIPLDWIVIGLVICSIVGIVFGTYPAYKAANLDPIESLRYE